MVFTFLRKMKKEESAKKDQEQLREAKLFLAEAAMVKAENHRNPFPLPAWVDPVRVQRGQHFVKEHFFSVIFAHFVSLIFLLCYMPVRLVLVRTQKSETTLKAMKRYLSTLVHIKNWYESDILQESGPGTKDVIKIRGVHNRVATCISKWRSKTGEDLEMNRTGIGCPVFSFNIGECDFNNNDTDGFITPVISQLDMAVTQFCFSGLIYLHPRAFGIYLEEEKGGRWSREGFMDFIHLWALLGHLLGIEDKYNLCLEKNLWKNQVILEKVLVPELRNPNEVSMGLVQSLVAGIGKIIPFLSLNALFIFLRRQILETSFPGFNKWDNPHLFPSCSAYDQLCSFLMLACFRSWIKILWFQSLLNYLLSLAIFLSSYIHLRNPPSSKKSRVLSSKKKASPCPFLSASLLSQSMPSKH